MNSLVDAKFVTLPDAGTMLLAQLKQEALKRLQNRLTTCTPELISELAADVIPEITGDLN
jgi:hypothetical protein